MLKPTIAGPRVSSPLGNNPVFESSFVPLTYIVETWSHRDPIAGVFLGGNQVYIISFCFTH